MTSLDEINKVNNNNKFYPILCIIPYERHLIISNDKIVEYTDSITNNNDTTTVNVHNSNNSIENMNLATVGNKFHFNYIDRLVFLHEKDLRNLLYNNIDNTGEEFREQVLGGMLWNYLSIRYVTNNSNNSNIVASDNVDTVTSENSKNSKKNDSDHSPKNNNTMNDSNGVGYGLFVDEFTPKNTFIGEYIGIVSSTSSNNNNTDYFMDYADDELATMPIDALEYGNLIRFINHSYNPNAEFRKVIVDNIIHMICVTIKDIHANDQLLVNYGQSYWANKDYTPIDITNLVEI